MFPNTYASGCKYLSFVCRYRLHSVSWFSYWFDNLGFITEGNTYRRCDASSLPIRGNTDVVPAAISYPHSIITNYGTNLSKGAMKRLCQHEHIWLDVASVAHTQSNGQAERANQEILWGIKPRLMVPLERTPVFWVEELPSVLWGKCTLPTDQLVIHLSSWFMV